MNQSKITTRYAKAIFKLAVEQNILDKIKKDFDYIKKVYEIKEFQEFINSPILQVSKKQEIISQIFQKKIDNYTLNFLLLLAENRRETLLKQIILDFNSLYRKHENITEVSLITAWEIDDKLKKQIIQMLKQAFNSKIELEHKVDTNLIGGFIITIEDKRLDASISGQLKKIKKELTQ